MSNNANLLTGLMVGLLAVSKTAFSSEVSGLGNADIQCDDETREFVLTSDNPLYFCSVENELSPDELLQCKKIVACMVEQGVMVETSSLIKFGACGVDQETVMQPIKKTVN